jgi:tetratricopeptide (TPR) repeat protein
MVTSRNQLAGVAAHHRVLAIRLDLLQPSDSVSLLSKVLGGERTDAEPQATAELAELCGHLPLALRIAAAKLVSLSGQRIADFVAELRGHDRLDALAVEGDSRSVNAVFATAYRALTPQPALVFRSLGLHPGVTFGPHATAALTHLGTRQAQATLDTLSTAHLVNEVGPGRYRFHDLVRLYAVERAQAEIPADGRAAAIGRLLDWYLAVGDTANRLIDPGRDRVALAWEAKPALPPFPDIDSVLSFLDLEYPNLVPITAHAAHHGAEQAAWQLAYLMVGYLDSRGHAREREQMWRWGLAAATKLDDLTVKGLAHSGLGLAHIRMRRFAEGLRELETALDLMRATGDKRGEGHALSNMALVYSKQRRYQEAADFYHRALEIHEAGDHAHGVALALNNLGHVLALTGQTGLALSYLERGLRVAKELGSGRVQAALLRTIGNVHHRAGDYPLAVGFLHEALDLKRMVHDDSYQVEALNDLATFHAAAGDWEAALSSATQALDLATALGDQHLQAAAGLRLGRALIGRGELAAAGERLRQALELRHQTPDEFEEAMLHEQLARLAALRGRHDESGALRDRAISLYESANAIPEAEALRVWRG